MTATWQLTWADDDVEAEHQVDDGPWHPTVVVAVDGQPASINALEWAHEHLIGPDHQVIAVTAYVLPMVAPDTLLSTQDARAVENTARVDAERALRAVFGPAAAHIHHVVEAGTVEQLLDRYADDDAVVVVGAPARRRLRDRLRPSSARRLAGRFHCPVIIVPDTRTGDDRRGAEAASAA